MEFFNWSKHCIQLFVVCRSCGKPGHHNGTQNRKVSRQLIYLSHLGQLNANFTHSIRVYCKRQLELWWRCKIQVYCTRHHIFTLCLNSAPTTNFMPAKLFFCPALSVILIPYLEAQNLELRTTAGTMPNHCALQVQYSAAREKDIVRLWFPCKEYRNNFHLSDQVIMVAGR